MARLQRQGQVGDRRWGEQGQAWAWLPAQLESFAEEVAAWVEAAKGAGRAALLGRVALQREESCPLEVLRAPFLGPESGSR